MNPLLARAIALEAASCAVEAQGERIVRTRWRLSPEAYARVLAEMRAIAADLEQQSQACDDLWSEQEGKA